MPGFQATLQRGTEPWSWANRATQGGKGRQEAWLVWQWVGGGKLGKPGKPGGRQIVTGMGVWVCGYVPGSYNSSWSSMHPPPLD